MSGAGRQVTEPDRCGRVPQPATVVSMMTHPADAMLLAETRHRGLLTTAAEFRAAARAGTPGARGALAGPTGVHRAGPSGPAGEPTCRPDPRRATGRRAGRHRPRYALRGHRAPRRVR